MVDRKSHWEGVYTTKSVDAVGWFKERFDISMSLIAEVAVSKSARILDVGGGASLLVDSLLNQGYEHVAVLDIAAPSLEHARHRLGEKAHNVEWIVADVLDMPKLGEFDIWHDRAVFHFLLDENDRQKYVNLARRTIPVGGHAIISTFALDGPPTCSGLEVCRYNGETLTSQLGKGFQLIRTVSETHVTPSGKPQAFLYALLRRI